MKIVLKRESGLIEFFEPTQKHIKDILQKEKVEDLTAEFLVFVNNFVPEKMFNDLLNEKFTSWKHSDHAYYVSTYITIPAMVEFAKLKKSTR